MKAVLLDRAAPVEERPLRVAELARPVPAEGEILVRVSCCGMCHTDLDEVEGRLSPSKFPIIPGHQIVGTVAAKGEGAEAFSIGERVGVSWLYSSCGRCGFCREGCENLCEQARWTGKDADGGYAEYVVVPQRSAHPIPEVFSDAQAAPLFCAGVIGYRAVRLAEIRNGQVVGLFGFGASGHIVIQVLRRRFPDSPVFVFTRSAEHRALAKKLGAAWAAPPDEMPPAKVDKAIDFTPVGETVRRALVVLERGGRLVINAIRKMTAVPELDYAEHLWLEKEIKSVANVTRRDAEEFLVLAGQIPIVPEVEEFELEEANEALILLKQAKIRAAAVLNLRAQGLAAGRRVN